MPPHSPQVEFGQEELLHPPMNPRRIKTTTEQIVDYIRQAIFDGRFLPGDKLKENEIAKWLAVSRTPVREALCKLEAEGLAEFQPNKGVQVPLLENQDIDEICEMRMLIELQCIRKFMRLATASHFAELQGMLTAMADALDHNEVAQYMALGIDFHAYIIQQCQNMRMYSCFQRLRNTIRCAQAVLGKDPAFCRRSLRGHQDLIKALKERSRDCEKMLRRHIEASCERMRTNLRKLKRTKQREDT